MDKKFEKTKFITGLKGLAILGIFLIHAEGGLRSISAFTNALVDFGKYGVIVFFVISAFTLSMSLDRKKNVKYSDFLCRRLRRILPLFYIVALISFFLGGSEGYLDLFGIRNDITNLILGLSFFNYFDLRYRNSLIGVEWILPIELIFYIVLPFIFKRVKRSYSLLLSFIIFSLCINLVAPFYYSIIDPNFADLAFHWSFEKYLFSFALGIGTYVLIKKYPKVKFHSLSLLGIISLTLLIILRDVPFPEIYVSVITSLVILTSYNKSFLSKFLFENKFIVLLGTISFPFYLSHLIVIKLLENVSQGISLVIQAFFITFLTSFILYKLELLIHKNYLIIKIFHKLNNNFQKLLFFLFIIIGIFLTSLYIVKADNSLTTITYKDFVNLDSMISKDGNTKSSLLFGSFVAKDDYLGIVVIPKKFNSKNNTIIHFKIKEKNSANWHDEIEVDISNVLVNKTLQFGFPPIEASKGKEYYFEIESVKENVSDSINLDRKRTEIITKYQYPKQIILQEPNHIVQFIQKKFVSTYKNNNLVLHVIFYFAPLLIFTFRKKIMLLFQSAKKFFS